MRPDGFDIPGRQQLSGATLDSFGDHRIAMAFTVAALVAKGESLLHDSEAASVSFPGFYEQIETIAERVKTETGLSTAAFYGSVPEGRGLMDT